MFKSCCHCGAGVRRTPLRSRSIDRAGRRDSRKALGNPPPCHCERRKACGNPFPRPLSLRSRVNGCGNPSPSRVLRIPSCLPLLRCPKVVFRLEREQLLTAAPAVARFFLHRSESNVTQNDRRFCHSERQSQSLIS